jgi:hypothetical protein
MVQFYTKILVVQQSLQCSNHARSLINYTKYVYCLKDKLNFRALLLKY